MSVDRNLFEMPAIVYLKVTCKKYVTNLCYGFFRTLKSTLKWYDNVRYLATWYWNFKMNLFVVLSKKIPFMRVAAFSTKGTLTGKLNIRIYLTRLIDFTKEYPLTRGMITYSFTWTISNLCQQSIRGNKEWDFAEALRFCLYGGCFVAPTLHGWLRLAVIMWPQQNFRSTLAKVGGFVFLIHDLFHLDVIHLHNFRASVIHDCVQGLVLVTNVASHCSLNYSCNVH